jgi:hypothetical protein
LFVKMTWIQKIAYMVLCLGVEEGKNESRQKSNIPPLLYVNI